jgi:hypothetical protein
LLVVACMIEVEGASVVAVMGEFEDIDLGH